MAECFTGFWDDGESVATTVGPVALDDLMERLRARLEAMPAGTNVRIDLIAWDE